MDDFPCLHGRSRNRLSPRRKEFGPAVLHGLRFGHWRPTWGSRHRGRYSDFPRLVFPSRRWFKNASGFIQTSVSAGDYSSGTVRDSHPVPSCVARRANHECAAKILIFIVNGRFACFLLDDGRQTTAFPFSLPSAFPWCFVCETFVLLKVSDMPSCFVQAPPAHRKRDCRNGGSGGVEETVDVFWKNPRPFLGKPSRVFCKYDVIFCRI